MYSYVHAIFQQNRKGHECVFEHVYEFVAMIPDVTMTLFDHRFSAASRFSCVVKLCMLFYFASL